MTEARDLLRNAVTNRLAGHYREIRIQVCFCLSAIAFGIAVFLFLWLEFRSDESELVSQLASGATTLVTVGVGGIFANRTLKLRDDIRLGREWLDVYVEALGPPPDELFDDVKERVLSWLEG